MADGALERIQRDAGGIDLVDILADLAPTDLQSVMLEVYRRQAARLSPAQLLARFEDSRFSRPAVVDPGARAAFEGLAWSSLPDGYQALELSPLCPLGTSSTVATVDQNKVVSTVRNAEVVADTTNVLALECARRRRALLADRSTRFQPVGLASYQRQVRAQTFGDPLAWAHFGLLGMVAAGRDQGSLSFEAQAFTQQIGYFASLLQQFRPEWGIDVAVTCLHDGAERLSAVVRGQLSERFPDVVFRDDPTRLSGRGYYLDLCYKLFVGDRSGTMLEVGDGGCTDWTRLLLSDRKERLVIGAIGVDRILV